MFQKIYWWKNKKQQRNCEEKEYDEINFSEFYVIDVSTRTEYNEGHLNGSVNIPLKDIKAKIVTMQPNKDKNILLYCQSGTRSKKAMRMLAKLGYRHVCHLKGGLENIE